MPNINYRLEKLTFKDEAERDRRLLELVHQLAGEGWRVVQLLPGLAGEGQRLTVLFEQEQAHTEYHFS